MDNMGKSHHFERAYHEPSRRIWGVRVGCMALDSEHAARNAQSRVSGSALKKRQMTCPLKIKTQLLTRLLDRRLSFVADELVGLHYRDGVGV